MQIFCTIKYSMLAQITDSLQNGECPFPEKDSHCWIIRNAEKHHPITEFCVLSIAGYFSSGVTANNLFHLIVIYFQRLAIFIYSHKIISLFHFCSLKRVCGCSSFNKHLPVLHDFAGGVPAFGTDLVYSFRCFAQRLE